MTPPDDQPSVEQRQGYIGGSDASAVLGLSPFCSPFACFAQKVGAEIPRAVDSVRAEKFEFGHAMEPVIAASFTKRTGIAHTRPSAQFQRSAQYPFMGGHVDFDLPSLGCFLECKNIEFRSDEWGDPDNTLALLDPTRDDSAQVTLYYLAQCDHYMIVRDCNFCFLAALFGGCRLVIYRLARSAERTAILLEAEERFWNRIQSDDPPPFESIDDLTLALRSKYLASFTGREAKAAKRDGAVQLDSEACQVLDAIRSLRAAKSRARQEERILIEELMVHLGGKTGYLQVGGEKWGSLLMQERSYLDDFGLQMEAPELVAKYTRSRRVGPILRLTGLKEEPAADE